jgi:D-glycero-D-manno-heptose 1,7-bisphosphate phosphatase
MPRSRLLPGMCGPNASMTSPASTGLRPAVFLDRDGTVNEERGYLDRLEMLALFPWTADAIRLINRAGWCTVVVTNQAAVARGLIDEPFLLGVHREIDRRLVAGDARIDGYYYCPHLADAPVSAYRVDCQCRKPRPGMLQRAARELGLDLSRSVMVGDRWLDVECGRAAGARTVLVRSGHGHREAAHPPAGVEADAILNNLMEAVGWALRSSSR